MNILKAYQYFFFRIYKTIDNISVPRFWSEWKAIGFMVLLEIWLINTLDVFYHYFTKTPMRSTTGMIEGYQILVILFLVLLNYFVFYHNNNWKNIIENFKSNNGEHYKYGGLIVWSIVVSIIFSYLLCIFYLMGKLIYI